MKLGIITLVLLSACGSQVCSPGPLGTGLDCPSEVTYVEASPDYEAVCGRDPVIAANRYWGLEATGIIRATVEYVEPGTDGYIGETLYRLERNRRGHITSILGGTVETTSCDPVVLAHEIGHLLGYPDTDVRGDIMCWSNACSLSEID